MAPAGKKGKAPPEDLFTKPDPAATAEPAAAPAAPAAVPPAAPAAEAIEVPQIDEKLIPNENVRKSVIAMRKIIEANAARITELESAAPKQVLELQARVKELEGTLNETSDQLQRLGLEHDPRFKAKFDKKMEVVLTRTRERAKEWGLDEAIVDRAANMSPKERAKYLEDTAPEAKNDILQYLTDYDKLATDRRDVLKDYKQSTLELRKEDERAQAEREKRANQVRAEMQVKVVNDLSAAGFFVFQESQTDPDWNAEVKARQQQVLAVFASEDAGEVARTLALGVAAPKLLEMYREERAERIRLSSLNAKRASLRPRSEGDDPPSSEPAGPKPGESADYLARKHFGRV